MHHHHLSYVDHRFKGILSIRVEPTISLAANPFRTADSSSTTAATERAVGRLRKLVEADLLRLTGDGWQRGAVASAATEPKQPCGLFW
jgi:hypothetical protein